METAKERAERIKKGKLREGWTTGTCASAASKAATLLFFGRNADDVEVELPIKGRTARLKIFRAEKLSGEAIASTIKDAGDDPDVTHGAEIGARVYEGKEKGIVIIGGEGVGRVTKSGLGLEVGSPDITPVPMKMIKKSVRSVLEFVRLKEDEVSLVVEIFVPEGRERAKKTLLERLGVVGGIGILGTLGIVVPYSTGAWRASIARQISVAVEEGVDTIVGTTGRQSEEFARRYFRDIPDISFVDFGDFIGFTLKYAKQKGIRNFIYAGFPAKISKFAKGEDFTHAKKSSVDINFLVDLANDEVVSEEVIEVLKRAGTVREFTELAKSFGLLGVFLKLAKLAKERCEKIAQIHSEVVIFDFEGSVLAHVR